MTHEPVTFEGVFERRGVLEGTRSERESPVLVVTDAAGAERIVRVHLVGDTTFDDRGLDPYVGLRVRVGPGTWRNRVLRVTAEQIAPVDPPPPPAVSTNAPSAPEAPTATTSAPTPSATATTGAAGDRAKDTEPAQASDAPPLDPPAPVPSESETAPNAPTSPQGSP